MTPTVTTTVRWMPTPIRSILTDGWGNVCDDEWVAIEAGTLWMGSPDGVTCPDGYPGSCDAEAGRSPYGECEVLHEVTLTYDYEMYHMETTQNQFEAAMGYNPSNNTTCGGDCPVERVSLYEALAYANTLSQSHGLDLCYDCSGTQPDFTCTLKAEYGQPFLYQNSNVPILSRRRKGFGFDQDALTSKISRIMLHSDSFSRHLDLPRLQG